MDNQEVLMENQEEFENEDLTVEELKNKNLTIEELKKIDFTEIPEN